MSEQGTESFDANVERAKLAEQAERYEDMAEVDLNVQNDYIGSIDSQTKSGLRFYKHWESTYQRR